MRRARGPGARATVLALLLLAGVTGQVSAQALDQLLPLLPEPLPGWEANAAETVSLESGDPAAVRLYKKGDTAVIVGLAMPKSVPQGDPADAVKNEPALQKAGARAVTVNGQSTLLLPVGGTLMATTVVADRFAVFVQEVGGAAEKDDKNVLAYLQAVDFKQLAALK